MISSSCVQSSQVRSWQSKHMHKSRKIHNRWNCDNGKRQHQQKS